MLAVFAIIALGFLLLSSLILFGNELYYRKRVSAVGIIVMVCTVFLMYYLHGLNDQILTYVHDLAKYQTVPPLKGE
ncbi:hypothetical protein AVU38_gp131 [Ralstonia phage RSL2]|uniref:hypothetical protein n=1 Tax=Ralstonia phage RSL2 TaxID=1585840 RepID=UPI00054A8640|nr:hypothetical protein AVU38_gp131 [Ralstonia phage RSL2]